MELPQASVDWAVAAKAAVWYREAMEALQVDHLVVGGGLLGLALADQILRRGGDNVLVIEAESAPSRRGLGGGGVVLRTGLDAYRAVEDRALLLLEEWPDYLGVDPLYRRVETQKYTYTEADGNIAQAACSDGGLIDTVRLVSALHEHVRGRRGRLLFDAQLEQIERTADRGFRFRAAGREGVANNVYLTGSPTDARWQQVLATTPSVSLSAWHEFHLVDVAEEATILLAELPQRTVETIGLALEEDDDDADGVPTGACWVQDGTGGARLLLEGAPTTTTTEPTVDWAILEHCRRELGPSVAALLSGTVRRGSAELCWGLDPMLPQAAATKLWVAGSFGMHGVLLSLGLAEQIAISATTPGT
ncbi:MAG: hypothetical protein AAF581_17290 [Planctomycetota bacterium]